MNAVVRAMRPEEYPQLREFLYLSIFVHEGEALPGREILDTPEFQVYLEGFGSGPADCAFVAEVNGELAGAAWARIMEDYGHVDGETPSLAISLKPEYRGQGLGTALLSALLTKLGELGYRQASLSVQKANYAVRLYEKAGFRVLQDKGEEYIMVCNLR